MSNTSNTLSMPYDKTGKRMTISVMEDLKREITTYLAQDLDKISSYGVAPWVREIALEPALFLRRRGIDTHALANAVKQHPEIVADILSLMESHRLQEAE